MTTFTDGEASLGCGSMPFFGYHGSELHYVDADRRKDKRKGLALVFVHGAGSSHIVWTLQKHEFCWTNRVVAPDLSGHGASDNIEGEATIDGGYTHEIAALVDYLKIRHFVLIGHSMGGGVVMSYVLHPEFRQPRGIVLVGASADLELAKLIPRLAFETIETELLMLKSRLTGDVSEAFAIKRLDEQIKRENPQLLLRDLRACDRFDISGKLGSIETPCLVIHGQEDHVIEPGLARMLAEQLPRADVAFVRGADHIPMLEKPDEFNRLLAKFVRWAEASAS
ncbi:MAG: hypothetical protein C4K49_10490 [Candidatus Thorarchaeota archaeon]|nr:MAG: hypothetical protein C4K49_10490 [Candidatus Thorarchaeota archaeon]